MLNLAPVTPAGRLRLAVEGEFFRGPDRTPRRLGSWCSGRDAGRRERPLQASLRGYAHYSATETAPGTFHRRWFTDWM